MASVFHLYSDAFNIKQKVVERYWECIASDKKLYFSALIIQRTWKGYVVRKLISEQRNAATTIQRFVRGWLTRLHLPKAFQTYYYNTSVALYNKQATKIQSLWRAYRVRKQIHSVKEIKAERAEVDTVSKEMQGMLQKAFEKLRPSTENQTRDYMEKILLILFDRHHLLRTRIQEGIFSIHGSYELSCVEKILKSFNLTSYMKELKKIQEQKVSLEDQVQHQSNDPLSDRFDLYKRPPPKPYKRMLLYKD